LSSSFTALPGSTTFSLIKTHPLLHLVSPAPVPVPLFFIEEINVLNFSPAS
ncbi:hypothetical protein ILYODFUR_038929, partial [Ilyodon furcidens]